MKYQIGDKVQYLGNNKDYHGSSAKVTHTRLIKGIEKDVIRGANVEYPKPGFDYTIQFKREAGIVDPVLDVMESDLG